MARSPLLMSAAAKALRQLLVAELGEVVQIGGWVTTNPNRAMALTVYPSSDDPVTGDVEFAAQLRIRGAMGESPLAMLDRQEEAWSVLCERHPVVDTDVLTVIAARRQVTAPLGLDAQGRPEIADTYYLRTDRLEE